MAGTPGLLRPGRRTLDVTLLAVIVTIAVTILSTTTGWRMIELRLFDFLSTVSPPARPADTPVVVAIDEPAMAEIGRQWPWPRDLHGRLIGALREAGVRAIGLDIIFAEPSNPVADQALADVMGPDVVLAADETLVRTPHADQFIRVDPLPLLTDKGALPGLASVLLDNDGVMRRVPGYLEGFAAQVIKARGGEAPIIPAGALLQTFGPARTHETISYYQALDPKAFLPADFLRGRTVIVGLSTQSAPTVEQGGADMYATSYTLRTRHLVAGAELQATVLDNLSGRLFIMPVPDVFAALGPALAAALAGLVVLRRTGWYTVVLSLFALAALVGTSFLLIDAARIFAPALAPSLAFFAVAGIQSARDYAAERRMRLGITRAFSQYLSPVLVQRLADNPGQLKLGGERRVLTILFCDVRGFTTISEQMRDDPEGLTTLINRLLNPLSAVILKSGGTIDKYIGDAIMAFWNAPVEEPDHAVRAIEAAAEMLAAVDRLNEERSKEAEAAGLAFLPLRIGIGINTGSCVVGNMGSDFRFNYSALGDPVNLAARLESETKGFGVPILVGEDTARHVDGRIALAELDRIAVKGKSQVVAVYAPMPDAKPAALNEHAGLVADVYRKTITAGDGRWDALGTALPELTGYYAAMRARLARPEK